jgi:beta-galactosidase
VAYWQWRSAYGGQEQYHGTVVDQSGQPRPFYEELGQIGKELATISPLVAGSTPKARVAMLNDYESRWSIQFQRHHQDFDYVAHLTHYYRALATRNIGVDILPAGAVNDREHLSTYKLIFAPALIIVGEDVAASLRDFVERGGHLVLTIRSGMKDRHNALLPSRQPGPLAELAGIEVEEYYALLDPVPVRGNWFEGVSQIWAERLKLRQGQVTQVIARYGKSNGWLDDQVAISVNAYGKGLVYYVGAYLDPVTQQSFVDRLLKNAEIRSLPTPEGVEARLRVRPDGQEICFMINHTPEERCVTPPWPAYEHLSGKMISGELELAPYGVAVLTRV